MTADNSPIRRSIWAAVDQALSSLTNFALTVFVARLVSVESFGAFAIVLGVYVVFSGIGQGLVSTPLTVRYSAALRSQYVVASREAAGASVAVGCLLGLCCLLASVLNLFGTRDLMLVLGVGLPGLLLQDYCRFVFVAGGHPSKAVVNDGVWTVVQLIGFAVLLLTHRQGVTAIVAVWAGAATVAGAIGCLQAGWWPRFSTARTWFAREGALGVRFAIESVVVRSAVPVAQLMVAAIAGLAVVGGLRGAMVVFSPLNLVLQGGLFVVVPEVVRMLGHEPKKAERVLFALSGLALLGAVTIATTALLLPQSVGSEILGRTWSRSVPLLPWISIYFAAIAASMGPQIAIRAWRAAGTSLSIQILSGILILVAAPIGAHFGGGSGAATGLAFSSIASCIVWWLTYRRMRPLQRHAGNALHQA